DVGMQTGMLMHADIWRELFKPRMASIICAAKEICPKLPIFYHSCGNPTQIIGDLVEIGVTVLNPLQPECVDHLAIKEAFGDRLAFWGGVSAQGAMSFGKPEDVRTEVRRCIEVLGKNGGYLIGPNHVVEPEVPWENLLAFFDAVEEFGGA
ncbi:MAG: uroporphyrinogen decarboxylase family protein, partial [Clostridia bacterium]